MKRILIDLTDLEHWNGLHGGTQRVTYGIAKYFYIMRESLPFAVQFIAFSGELNEFRATSFGPIYDRVEAKSARLEVSSASTATPQKSILKKLVPARVRANPRVHNLYKALSSSQDNKQGQDATDNKILFGTEDIVLILGKPWDNLAIGRTLTKHKATAQFKLVQLVYDLVICLYPHLQNPVLVEPYTTHMLEACKTSDLMLAISKSTASDLQKFCNLNNLKTPTTKVIRLGDAIEEAAAPVPTGKLNEVVGQDFIACIGTVEIRKNHTLLYYAYKLAAERGIQLPKLLIIGGQGWLTGDIQYMLANDPALKGQIIMLHDVDDAGLRWVYKHCLFTVYPSMYEGWGLPIAESLAHGKLCISSNTSSMPEIAGDLIDYFSPYSPDACLDKLQQYVNAKDRSKREKNIKTKYEVTTWEDTFKKVLEYIRQC